MEVVALNGNRVGQGSSDYSAYVDFSGRNEKPPRVLIAQTKSRTRATKFNQILQRIEHHQLFLEIDYCDSATSLICALEDQRFDVVFLDHALPYVDVGALLKFINQTYPFIQLIVTAAPVWETQREKQLITSLCSSCSHDDFSEMNVEHLLIDRLKRKKSA